MLRRFRKNAQWLAEYAAAWPVLALLTHLPERAALAVGRFLGRAAYWLCRKDRRWCDVNLQLVYGPNLSARERRRLAQAVFEHHATTIVEILRLDERWVRERCVGEGLHRFRKWREANPGRGVVFVAGHIGNFEAISAYAKHVGMPATIVARRLDNPWLERALLRRRERYGSDTVPRGAAALRHAVRRLRGGDAIGIAVDQNCGDRPVFVDVMGIPAATARGAATLALRENAGVFLIYSHRTPDGMHRIVVSPEILVVRTGDFERDVAVNTQRFSREYEKRILEHPDQYHWQHPRWRTRPDGTRWTLRCDLESMLAERRTPPLLPPARFRQGRVAAKWARAA